MLAFFIFMARTHAVVHMQQHTCISFQFVSMWACVGLCVCLCDFSFVCVVVHGFMNVSLWCCVCMAPRVWMCVCVGLGLGCGGSLMISLNFKQLEVMKYLGSTGSWWILIQPFSTLSNLPLSSSFSFHPDSTILKCPPCNDEVSSLATLVGPNVCLISHFLSDCKLSDPDYQWSGF